MFKGVAKSERLLSIDAFRGVTIALMVLVNMPGSWDHVYPPLDHAEWFGWTPTVCVFPWFLFACGLSMVFSFARRSNKDTTRARLYRHIAIRSTVIVVIGLLINFFPDFNFSTLRFSGVLQRIGITYFLTGFIYLNTDRRMQLGISAALLLGYWALLSWIPAPGFEAGDLSPAGNVVGWIDRTILGVHGRAPTDPEGLLGILPSIVSMLAGCITAQWLRADKNKNEIVGWLYFVGWILIIGGLSWSIVFPISKKLWTSSYVVFTTGAALQLLAVCYWLIEIKGYSRWAKPAIIYGSNAMLVYILHIFEIRLLIKALKYTQADGTVSNVYTWIWQNGFVPWAGNWGGSLAFAIFHVFFWFGVMALFYRQRVFLKI